MDSVPFKILRIARLFLDLSQDQVAEISGVSRATIQRIEQGKEVDVGYFLRLQTCYIRLGIIFEPPKGDLGWRLCNMNTKADASTLNSLSV